MSSFPEDLEDSLREIGEDLDRVIEAAAENTVISDSLTKQISENLIFFGKSLALWEDMLAIPLPEGDISHQDFKNLYLEYGKKVQIASHYYSLASAATSISETSIKVKKADIVTALIGYYHEQSTVKLPPATVLERLADNYIKKASSLSIQTKIIRDFWKHKLETLEKVSKTIQNLSVLRATDLKYLGEG